MIIKTNFNKGDTVWTVQELEDFEFMIPIQCKVIEIKIETQEKGKLIIRYYLEAIFPIAKQRCNFLRPEEFLFAEREGCQEACDEEQKVRFPLRTPF